MSGPVVFLFIYFFLRERERDFFHFQIFMEAEQCFRACVSSAFLSL